SSEHENKYIIVIKDDGVGFDINVNKKKKSVGMTNSLYRISKMTKGKININSTIGIGTMVTITIPKKAVRSKNENNFS
ncbi:MAG: hypothetical protein RR957_03875, partial [Oscillospiraceae bacterium]